MYKNKSIKITLLIAVLVMLLLSSCSKETQQNENVPDKNYDKPTDMKKEEIEKKDPYDFDLLYSYKNISLSDTEKVKELINQLSYSKELPIERVEYEIRDGEMLRIDYRMNLTAGQEYKVNHTKMMADMVILFSLIDNLNAVEYNFDQAHYSYGGVPVTRKDAEQVTNLDIDALGKTKEVFLHEMPQKVANIQWDPDVMSIITYDHIMGLDE